ncbi:hypothetical protein JI735_19870 [Paenibacillus sonchi]|uniref:Uncharacterized protein n=1 Tax=Paenibacillus sonchi TaxID=373687 RepID=A0A974P811_9BACL|nr:hypothetical protein [Paenibacillus sonchi]QQZ58985.1 hypothetical protein JI735_19870 [Paenibacillus sonchi]
MDKKLKQSLKVAALRREMIVVWLFNGDKGYRGGISRSGASKDQHH